MLVFWFSGDRSALTLGDDQPVKDEEVCVLRYANGTSTCDHPPNNRIPSDLSLTQLLYSAYESARTDLLMFSTLGTRDAIGKIPP
jgi:hypothetical protein